MVMNMNEIKEIAQGYIKLIAGALAIRSKTAPTVSHLYDPLARSMASLAMCLRNPHATMQEYMQAIKEASSWWDEWYVRGTQCEQRIYAEHEAAVKGGDWIAALAEAQVGNTQWLIELLTVKE